MHPNASEQVRTGPSRSQQVRKPKKTQNKLQKLRKFCEHLAKFREISKILMRLTQRLLPARSAGALLRVTKKKRTSKNTDNSLNLLKQLPNLNGKEQIQLAEQFYQLGTEHMQSINPTGPTSTNTLVNINKSIIIF